MYSQTYLGTKRHFFLGGGGGGCYLIRQITPRTYYIYLGALPTFAYVASTCIYVYVACAVRISGTVGNRAE